MVVTAGRPLYWAPLGWGEPVIPWWGRPGFVGVASWRGWGGPRVVNNVVVNRTTNVNVTNITVYRNVHVTNAVVGVPAERFGQGQVQTTPISQAQVQQLTPVHGALAVRPVAASVQPATSPAAPPPAAIQARPVVATRAPHDQRPALQAQGLATAPAVAIGSVAARRTSVHECCGCARGRSGSDSAHGPWPRRSAGACAVGEKAEHRRAGGAASATGLAQGCGTASIPRRRALRCPQCI